MHRNRQGWTPRRWWSLALLAPAQFMVILDVTVVNAALPSIGADLRLDRASLTWVVTAHTLSFGGLLLGGRLLPLHRRRGRADPVDEVAAGARLHA
jgi:MFS family permease